MWIGIHVGSWWPFGLRALFWWPLGDHWNTTDGPPGGAALPPSNDVPGMSPSITKHKQLQKPDFQHSVKKKVNIRRHSQKCQKYWNRQTHTTVVRENPQGLYMHTHFVALQKKKRQTTAGKKKKIRGTSKKPLLLLEQWVREILAFERLANMCQEKRFGITQAIFFCIFD